MGAPVTLVRALAVAGGLAGLGVMVAMAPAAPASPAPGEPRQASGTGTAGPDADQFVQEWSVPLPGATIAQSSPVSAWLGGAPAVVVGALDGKVYALNLQTGQPVAGWPATDPGAAPIQSSPSVDTEDGTTIFIGTGDAGHPTPGGYLALNADGTQKWFQTVAAAPGDPQPSGVQASLTVGNLQGTRAVVAGSLGQYEQELRTVDGAVMPGFAWFAADSEFSTPSVVNLYGQGRNFIVEGGESTGGNAYGTQYQNGGHIRILSPDGQQGGDQPSDGLVCQVNTTQGVESSPAVGDFLPGGGTGIVVGTGNTYSQASDSNKLIAIDPSCALDWERTLDGSTLDSPALVSALGDHRLQIAEGTSTGHDTGTVYLLAGDGTTVWTHPVAGQVVGGITSADLGTGYQDLLVPTTSGLSILDGRTGEQVALLAQTTGIQSSPLVTDNADHTIGITIAGYNPAGGQITHWEVSGTSGWLAREPGAWPMFHHDPQRSGTSVLPVSG